MIAGRSTLSKKSRLERLALIKQRHQRLAVQMAAQIESDLTESLDTDEDVDCETN